MRKRNLGRYFFGAQHDALRYESRFVHAGWLVGNKMKKSFFLWDFYRSENFRALKALSVHDQYAQIFSFSSLPEPTFIRIFSETRTLLQVMKDFSRARRWDDCFMDDLINLMFLKYSGILLIKMIVWTFFYARGVQRSSERSRSCQWTRSWTRVILHQLTITGDFIIWVCGRVQLETKDFFN